MDKIKVKLRISAQTCKCLALTARSLTIKTTKFEDTKQKGTSRNMDAMTFNIAEVICTSKPVNGKGWLTIVYWGGFFISDSFTPNTRPEQNIGDIYAQQPS